jgi:hypothetical protein
MRPRDKNSCREKMQIQDRKKRCKEIKASQRRNRSVKVKRYAVVMKREM